MAHKMMQITLYDFITPVTRWIFSTIFLDVFFFIFSWNLFPRFYPVKSLSNMSAHLFSEVNFVAASVLGQLD